MKRFSLVSIMVLGLTLLFGAISMAVTGTVLEFTGPNHSVDIPNDPTLQLTGPLTLEALVRSEDFGSYSPIISKGSAEYEVVADWRPGHGASLQWRSFDSGTGDTFPGFFEGYSGKWVHVAVVYDNGNVYAYRDGELFGVTAMPGMNPGTSKLVIGMRPWSTQQFRGQIAYVRIWNVARTADEIAANINTLTPKGAGLVSNYRFDEGYGEIAYDSAGTNYGTIVGARWSSAKN